MIAPSIDQAATMLATACTTRERLVAALALATAAQAEVERIRAQLRLVATDWLCKPCRQAWPANLEPADGNCPECGRPLTALR